jgi:hypothetical protein
MHRLACLSFVSAVAFTAAGCASMKQSDTARTGIEQLLVSSAIDRSLDKTDLRPIAGAKVFIEDKYLDCVDKNYLLVALHQRLLNNDCTIVDKAADAQVVLEIGSGGIGTDRQELFVGIPNLSAPIPIMPVQVPEVTFFNRNKANGTAKIVLVAYDVSTKQPVINNGAKLARSDHKSWNVLGTGHVVSGSVPDELKRATGEAESIAQISTPPAPTVTAQRWNDVKR